MDWQRPLMLLLQSLFFPMSWGSGGGGKGRDDLPREKPTTCPVFDRLFDIFAKIPLVESQASCARIGIAASHWRLDCSVDGMQAELSVFNLTYC